MPEPKVIIDYAKIVEYISEQFKYVWQQLLNPQNSSEEIIKLISNIKEIQVSDEQFFRKQENNRDLRRGTVYLVVRFSSGAINYASSVTPVSIYGLGVANQVKPVQMLLGTFASYWTTKNMLQGINTVKDMLQVWNTPEVMSNFNIVDDDFRNLYNITGNIIIGPAAIRVGTLTYFFKNQDGDEVSETMNIMSFKDNLHTNMDSQPFGDTNGFVQSEANFSTYVFSVSTYLLNSQLARDLLAMRGFRYRPDNIYYANAYSEDKVPLFSIADTNKTMKLRIDFTNDFNNQPGYDGPDTPEAKNVSDPVKGDNFYMYYKVVESSIGQEIAGIPTLSISFTR